MADPRRTATARIVTHFAADRAPPVVILHEKPAFKPLRFLLIVASQFDRYDIPDFLRPRPEMAVAKRQAGLIEFVE